MVMEFILHSAPPTLSSFLLTAVWAFAPVSYRECACFGFLIFFLQFLH